MYMGLHISTLYQEEIVAKGLQPTVTATWASSTRVEIVMIKVYREEVGVPPLFLFPKIPLFQSE